MRFIPRNKLNRSAVDLLEATVNLFPPGFFHARIYFGIKTLKQRIGQSGAGLGRQR